MPFKSVILALPVLLLSVTAFAGDAGKELVTQLDLSVCKSHEEYDALKKAVKERDKQAFMKLRSAKACETLPKGSAVKIIAANGTIHSKIEYRSPFGNSVGWTTYLKAN